MKVALLQQSRLLTALCLIFLSKLLFAQGSPSGQLNLLTQFINPCGLDGSNEFITLSTGNNMVNINDMAFASQDPNSGGTLPNLNFYWRGKNVAQEPYPTLTLNNEACGVPSLHCYGIADPSVTAEAAIIDSRISALNMIAGCTVFLPVPTDGNIPANSNVIFFLGAYICDFSNISTNLNFSNHCSTGAQYYAVFGLGDGGVQACGSNFSGYFSNTEERTSVSYVFTGGDNTNPANYNTNSVNYTPGDTPASGNAGLIDPNGNWINNQNCIPVSSLLPIELLNFYGKATSATIELRWQTVTEKNNAYIIVERSKNGIQFNEIGHVEGRGNSAELQSYTYIDQNPFPDINYYRLKQVDYDNQTTYHPIIAVEFIGKALRNSQINIYNITNELKIEFVEPLHSESKLTITDMMGRLVAQQLLNAGTAQYVLPIGMLPRGCYCVIWESKNSREVLRFLK